MTQKTWLEDVMKRLAEDCAADQCHLWRLLTVLDVCYLYDGIACPPGGTPYQWPSPNEILAIAKNFRASVWMHHGLYDDHDQYPPYTFPAAALPALRYAIAGARAIGHTICPYSSWFYAAERGLSMTQYLNAVRELKSATGCTGLYIDGMTFPYHGREWNQFSNQYVASILRRNIFGKNGTLILHATHHLGEGKFQPPDPNVERYMDIVVIGEDCPDFGSPTAANYAKEQIYPRIEAGVTWAMLNRTWPGDWLASHGASAISYAGMSLADDGSTRYSDPSRGAHYQAIIAAR